MAQLRQATGAIAKVSPSTNAPAQTKPCRRGVVQKRTMGTATAKTSTVGTANAPTPKATPAPKNPQRLGRRQTYNSITRASRSTKAANEAGNNSPSKKINGPHSAAPIPASNPTAGLNKARPIHQLIAQTNAPSKACTKRTA